MAGTVEPPLAAEVAGATGLRTGWTTGTCAAAAAKAAFLGLVTGVPPREVEVGLPDGRRVTFPVEAEASNRCVVQKDAGDDPDCTDGARMTAEVCWPDAPTRLSPRSPVAGADEDCLGAESGGGEPRPGGGGGGGGGAGAVRRGEEVPGGGGGGAGAGAARRGEDVPGGGGGEDRSGDAGGDREVLGGRGRGENRRGAAGGGEEGPGTGTGSTHRRAHGSDGGGDRPVAAAAGGADTRVATVLRAGDGIGVVTKPGLGLPVGGPSITEVPRRMIAAALAEVDPRPVVVTFSVPGGEAMAAKTSNARLGIVGGISILGTTGVVKPFSTAAYRASVVQQIDVAAAQGADVIVLCTGTRSDAFAQRALPHLPPVCFVEVGDFTGIALRRAAGNGFRRAVWVGMVGKITKLAGGVMMTHFRRSAVDTGLLAAVAREAGAPQPVVAAATETNTARHFYEACVAAGATEPLRLLCQRAAAACRAHVEGALEVEVVCVDFDGTMEVARG